MAIAAWTKGYLEVVAARVDTAFEYIHVLDS
jgi:hypothetical protein